MAIAPNLTFRYQFVIEGHTGQSAGSTTCQGSVSGVGPHSVGIVGPGPRFELQEGWLTLLPTNGWTQSFPIGWFSDVERPQNWPVVDDVRNTLWEEAQKESREEVGSLSAYGDTGSFVRAGFEAMDRALVRRGLMRSLASYALFVGESLGRVLRIGDEFEFSRDGNGDFCYSVLRDSEMVFSAGSVDGVDHGGAVAVWQDYQRRPNSDAEALERESPGRRVAERFNGNESYVSVRVKDQVFRLQDGEEVRIDPYYMFLARSNKNAFGFEFTPRAVHSAGRLDVLGKELMIDAARQLTAPKVRIL